MARKKTYVRRCVGKGITKVTRTDKSTKYEVRCRDHTGKAIYLGTYPTFEEAVQARGDYLDVRLQVKKHEIPPPEQRKCFSDLVDVWSKSLVNRTAYDDRLRITHHLKPYFGEMKIHEMESLHVIMRFLDDKRAPRQAVEPKPVEVPGRTSLPKKQQRGQKKRKSKVAKRLREATIRHLLNLLSRFFSWAVERGYAKLNPVRLIPQGKRPQQSPKLDRPWLQTDADVVAVFKKLPCPWNIMFLIGVTAGLRNGEIAGLRLSDCNFDEQHLRARYSYNGPLKEAKPGLPKIKFSPMTADVAVLLRQWINEREADGAGPEDFVFPSRTGGCLFDASAFDKQFKKVVKDLKLPEDMTWYAATRHSFASRKLSRGVPLDEVSRAMGHASPTTTKRYYDHFIQRTFSPEMMRPILTPTEDGELQAPKAPEEAKVLPMVRQKKEG